MKFNPISAPLFGGQRIEFDFSDIEQLICTEKQLRQNMHYYVRYNGRHLRHLCKINIETSTWFSVIPENNTTEDQKLVLYEAEIVPVDSSSEKLEIKKVAKFPQRFRFMEDSVKSLVTSIIEINGVHELSYRKIQEYVKENEINLTTTESVQNLDKKIATILEVKSIKDSEDAELVKYWDRDSSSGEFYDFLTSKCLFETRRIFFAERRPMILNSENDTNGFFYQLNDHNMITKFIGSVHMRECKNNMVYILSYISVNSLMTIDHQIALLMEFEKRNSSYSYSEATKEIIDNHRSEPEAVVLAPIYEEMGSDEIVKEVTNEVKNDEKMVEPITSTPKKGKPDSFCTKVVKVEEKDISKSFNLKDKKKSFFSLEKTESSKSTPINSSLNRAISAKPDDKLGPFNTKNADSISKIATLKRKDSSFVSLEEFLRKEIQNIKNDTSFQPIIMPTRTKVIKKSIISRLIKREKTEPSMNKNSRQRGISLLGTNKDTHASSCNTVAEKTYELNVSTLDPKSSFSSSQTTLPFSENSALSDSFGKNLEESETWSEFVDQKTIKKLSQKEVKRQDVIYELIKTENGFVKMLKTIYKVYYNGMITHLKFARSTVDIVIPKIVDLIAIHGTFLAGLTQAQSNHENYVVSNIADPINIQFNPPMSLRIIEIYGFICAHQQESVDTYKETIKSSKKFQDFVDACHSHNLLRRLSLPECLTFITQRVVKYPLLIEGILKCTKENDKEYHHLSTALASCKEVINKINLLVKDYDNQKELSKIISKIDIKTEVQFGINKKVKLGDVFKEAGNLLKTSPATGKFKHRSIEIFLVALDSYLIFFVENSQKLTLPLIENKHPVLVYKNLVVRTVATDPKALFIVDKGNAEIYEIVFTTHAECILWLNLITTHSSGCPTRSASEMDNTRPPPSSPLTTNYKTYFDKISRSFGEIGIMHKDILVKMKMIDKLNSSDTDDNETGREDNNNDYKERILRIVASLLTRSNEIKVVPGGGPPTSRARTRTTTGCTQPEATIKIIEKTDKRSKEFNDRYLKTLQATNSENWLKIKNNLLHIGDLCEKEEKFVLTIKTQFDCIFSGIDKNSTCFEVLVDLLSAVDDLVAKICKTKTHISDLNNLLQRVFDTKEHKKGVKKEAKDVITSLIDIRNKIDLCGANDIQVRCSSSSSYLRSIK